MSKNIFRQIGSFMKTDIESIGMSDTVYDWASSNNIFLTQFLKAMFLLALMGLLTSQMYILTHQ